MKQVYRIRQIDICIRMTVIAYTTQCIQVYNVYIERRDIALYRISI
jgi:hypothetical protein